MKFCAALVLLPAIGFTAPASLPLSFEENRGQSAPEVRFLAPGSPSVFFTRNEAVIAFASGDVLRIQPESAIASWPEALDMLAGTSNYLNREPSITGVRQYARILYRSVYPGIDLAYHGRRNVLEYDFDVAPGAHPERILLRFQGASRLRVDADGNLLAHLRNVTFIQRKPDAWQFDGGIRRRVEVRYLLRGKQEIAFAVGAYDRSRPLIIDPLIDYVTDFGSTATDPFHLGTVPYAIAADASGAYIAGDAASGQFPVTTGASTPASGNAGFVAKLSADGSQLIYATYLNLPAAQAIAVDAQGSAYVGGTDYIVKLMPDGSTFAYEYSFPTSLGAPVSHLVLDSANNAYVYGSTYSTNFPTTPGAYQATFPGQISIFGSNTADGFLIKLNPSGSVVYSTYLRDALATPVSQLATQFLAVDPAAQNAIIVTATTPTASGQASATVFKLGPTGQALSTANVAQSSIIVRSIATDSAGDLYLSCNGPGFNNQTTVGPNFLLEYDPSGFLSVVAGTPLSGDLHLDASGAAYIVAAERVGNALAETPAVTRWTSPAFGLESIVTNQLTTVPITDQIQSTAVDPAGNVYVVLTPGGSIGSPPQIPATPGAYQATGGGFAVLKADATALSLPPPPVVPPLIAGVTNAASGLPGFLAPGEILTIYGTNLGPAQLVNATFDANGLLPTTLAGTSVLIAGQPLSLLYASASQVAAIAPAALPGSTVVVSYLGALSPPTNTTLLAAIPGLFTANASGQGQGAILNQDESVNSVSNPAAPESVVSLFCSGCGVTTPAGTDGAVATSLAPLANPITVLIGGQPAVVTYAGSAPGLINGAVQINARIPFGITGDAVPVSILVGSDLPPSPPVTLAVH